MDGFYFAELELLLEHFFLVEKEKNHDRPGQKREAEHAHKKKQENIYLAFHKPIVIKKYSKMLNSAWKAQMYKFKVRLMFTI